MGFISSIPHLLAMSLSWAAFLHSSVLFAFDYLFAPLPPFSFFPARFFFLFFFAFSSLAALCAAFCPLTFSGVLSKYTREFRLTHSFLLCAYCVQTSGLVLLINFGKSSAPARSYLQQDCASWSFYQDPPYHNQKNLIVSWSQGGLEWGGQTKGGQKGQRIETSSMLYFWKFLFFKGVRN